MIPLNGSVESMLLPMYLHSRFPPDYQTCWMLLDSLLLTQSEIEPDTDINVRQPHFTLYHCTHIHTAFRETILRCLVMPHSHMRAEPPHTARTRRERVAPSFLYSPNRI